LYTEILGSVKSVDLMQVRPGTEWNYSYFPIVLDSEETLARAESMLLQQEIKPRRYFYPSLNILPFVEVKKMPVSESVSRRILCLPLFSDLATADVIRICECIKAAQK
jgi:dTDP-4-amino-4,6-dideoxygalactose transaminase